MLKKLLLAAILLFSHTIHAENTNEAGFTEICIIYTAALNTNMNTEQLSDYIFSNVAERVKSKDALEAHEAVMQLDSSQRYEIFKQSAEFSLKHNWDCEAMKKVMARKE
jgi:hypothetical protein